jgi:hypothetical protein
MLVLTAYGVLLPALILQPLYFVAGLYSSYLMELLHFVPTICFCLVALSAAISVLIEQRTNHAAIRNCASRHIQIVLFLVIVGIFSAIQASSWWRIDSKSFAFLVNLAVIPIVAIVIFLVIAGFRQAKELPVN